MGGTVPLSYQAARRMLEIVEAEADLVREIFCRYLELLSVDLLEAALDRQTILAPAHVAMAGREARRR